jgi:hypothetical protein
MSIVKSRRGPRNNHPDWLSETPDALVNGFFSFNHDHRLQGALRRLERRVSRCYGIERRGEG